MMKMMMHFVNMMKNLVVVMVVDHFLHPNSLQLNLSRVLPGAGNTMGRAEKGSSEG